MMTMKRNIQVLPLALGVLLLTATAGRLQAQDSRKPNVIVVYADDLGYGDLSCYGATLSHTPHIDSLAAHGLRFTRVHCTGSTCTPSRFSILTGEYAFRNPAARILAGNAPLIIRPGQATLGTVFQAAGYHTACIGKWHLGLGPAGGPDWNGRIMPGPDETGFDYCFIFPATADRVPIVYVENHRVVGLDTADPIEVSYHRPVGDDPTGKEHPELLKMRSAYGHNGTIVNGIGRIGWMKGGHRARWVDESLAGDFFDQARQFIEKNRHHPFFLYYALNEIHVPRMPDTRFKGKSRLGYRGDVILEMDHVVGRLLGTLGRLGLTGNTLILFTSDNGPVLDDGYADGAVQDAAGYKPAGPLRGGKGSLFEGGTCIPFIVSWPGHVSPGISHALVSQVDLLASFAALTATRLKPGDAPDSRDVLGALLGRTSKGRARCVEQNNSAGLALLSGRWKYIGPHKGPARQRQTGVETGLSLQPQLYDLRRDPAEQHNVAGKYPRKIKELAAELQRIRQTGNSGGRLDERSR
jgi:arylsulfatase A-like enzyme